MAIRSQAPHADVKIDWYALFQVGRNHSFESILLLILSPNDKRWGGVSMITEVTFPGIGRPSPQVLRAENLMESLRRGGETTGNESIAASCEK